MRYLPIIFVMLMLLFGCISDWRVVAEPSSEGTTQTEETELGEPESIGYLYVSIDYGSYYDNDSAYNVTFTLEDKNGNVVTSPGTAKLTIVDEDYNTLYEGSFTVSESDFKEQENYYPFYGRKAYAMSVDFSEINMSKTYYADFKVEFTPTGGSTFTEEKNQYLSYSLVEYDYDDYYYDDYLEDINLSSTKNQIQVTIVKGGMDTSYYGYNDYELELEIRNLASTKKDITLKDVTLVTKGKQYEGTSYYYDEELGNVYPNAAVSQTYTFYDVEELGDTATLYVDLLVLEGTTGTVTEYQIDFKP